MIKHLSLGDIELKLRRKRVKNINLRISRRSGEVNVSAPYHVSESYILNFLHTKQAWIRARIQESKLTPVTAEPEIINGTSLPMLGSNYTANIVQTRAPKRSIQIHDKTIKINTLPGDTQAQIKIQIESWYRAELQARLSALVSHWAHALNVDVNEYRIKKMRTKWGTCNITDRRIWISLELIKYPPLCLEYVVLHELTHLIEREHSARFYQIIERHLPQWREAEGLLDAHCYV